MVDDRKLRGLEEALRRVVAAFVSELPGEDEEEFMARRERILGIAKDRVLGSLNQETQTELGPHVSDLIRTKLVHDNPNPDPALRYSTLFSRLSALHVLERKWEVLYFLYLSSDSPPTASVSNNIFNGSVQPTETPTEEEADTGAFIGLHRLPDRRRGDPSGSLDNAGQNGVAGAPREGHADERKPKAAILEEHGAVLEPSEDTLLSSLPFTLLGVSSDTLPFASTGLTGPPPPTPLETPTDTSESPKKLSAAIPQSTFFPTTKLIIPTMLPLPVVSLLHTLAEPALLYRSLNEFVQSADDIGGGLIGQSLRAAIGQELRGYLSLIGGLEGEIRRAVSMADSADSRRIGRMGVTLKRCVVWTREATMGLRLMSLIVEQAKDKKGGQLISTIHGFSTSHGDPFVHSFAERLLSHVTRQFYDMLRRWIYDGELMDPYREFFVCEQDPSEIDHSEGRKGASSVWQDKYKIDEGMIPSIVDASFANKVFLIGKSLNFIRYGCGDSDWVNDYSRDASKELRYGDTATLESSIDEAYKTTMARLIQLMADKFRLFDHLTALKRYLLLGQGDFVALLMEGLSPNLERPANSIYRHNLTGQLEHAIRHSNAQHESQDVLKRLDARMLDPTHGDIGWDVFTLEYRIDAPVDVVITTYATRQYLKVFNMLWRIKRVEFHLAQAWRRYMTGARGILGAIDDKVGKDWKVARCVCAEMIHFVSQLQYYILYQVIEKAWNELQTAISKPSVTLDDLISAHANYLSQITSKGLLSPETAGRSKHAQPATKVPEEDSIFLAMLHAILKVMLRYKEAVDGLYGYSVAEYSRRQEMSARVETRTKEGRWGMTEADYHDTTDTDSRASTPLGTGRSASGNGRPDSSSGLFIPDASSEELLPSIRLRLKTVEDEFKSLNKTLLEELAYQPDSEMRMLGVQLNFNMFYELPVARKGKKEREREKERQREREKEVEREREKERERRKERERERERRKERERRERREKERREKDRDGEGDVVMD
ncbi:Spc98 family-domain-containing protein [Kalaharituber pfeilii]|nr:Spc98 family-domain-containing protein [Kalaharituber pfeilii]